VTDVEAPVISCPADMDIDLADPNDCFADVNISITDISDACTSEADMDVDIMVQLETSPGVFAAAGAETASITYNATSMEFDIVTTNLRTGANLITVTATDENGVSSICTFYINVNDLFGPVINSCPTDISVTASTGDCEVAVNWTPPAISDPCDAFTFTASHNPGDMFPVGETTTVTYTAMDPAGNVLSSTSVNNPDWTVTVLGGGVLYESSVVIPAGSESKIGLSTEAIVAGQNENLAVSILNGTGGDTDNSDNSATKLMSISL